jgi:hypothetical protein
MPVKRYDPCYSNEMGERVAADMETDTYGDYVLATDYDALLALAKRLRAGIVTTDDLTLLVDSAWLEEREE